MPAPNQKSKPLIPILIIAAVVVIGGFWMLRGKEDATATESASETETSRARVEKRGSSSSSSVRGGGDSGAADAERTEPLPPEPGLPQTSEEEFTQEPFHGRILDSDSLQPVAGATIESYMLQKGVFQLGDAYPTLLQQTQSDPEGRFQFDPVDVYENQVVGWRVVADGYTSVIALFPEGEGLDDKLRATIRINKGAPISGKVVDQEGEPIGGAQVGDLIITKRPGDQIVEAGPHPSSWTRTDGQGNFTLMGMELGDDKEHTLPATASGFAPGESEPVPAGSAGVEIVLIGREASLRGRVTQHDGRAAENVRVELSPRPGPNTAVRLVRNLESLTDSTGAYRFPDLPSGNYEVKASTQSEMTLGFDAVVREEVALTRGADKVVNLKLPEPATIRGQFVDIETGEGVKGVRLMTMLGDMTYQSEAFQVRSDEDGRFEVNLYVEDVGEPGSSLRIPLDLPTPWLPADEGRKKIDAPLTQDSLIVSGIRPGKTVEVRGELRRGNEIKGIVYEPDGQTVVPDNPVFYTGPIYGDAMTDEAGRFAFTAYIGAPIHLATSSEKGILAKTVTPREGEEIELVLDAYAQIKGTVTGPDGDPYPDLQVMFEHTDRDNSPYAARKFEEQGYTDAEGEYVIERVSPVTGEARVGISSSSQLMEPKPVRLTLKPGEVREDVDFQLSEGDYISGRVLTEEDEPIANATLFTNDSYLSGQTDPDGYFTIYGVPVDTPLATLTASAEGYEEQTKHNVSIYDGEILFRLRPKGAVTFLVSEPDGTLRSDYRIRLSREVMRFNGPGQDIVAQTIVTDPAGVFEMDDMSPGNYRAEVSELEGAQGMPPRKGSLDFAYATDSDVSEIVVPLQEPLSLEGVVVQSGTNAPVPGARVTLENPPLGMETNAGPPWARKVEVATDAMGRFAIGPITPGTYRLQAQTDDMSSEVTEAVLSEAGAAPVQIVLEPAPTVYGTLTGLGGEPMAEATIFFLKDGGAPVGEPLQATGGRYESRLPSAGFWKIAVTDSDTGDSAQKDVTLTAGQSAEVSFDFSGRVTLTGQVFMNGAPMERVSDIMLAEPTGNETFLQADLSKPGGFTAEVFPGVLTPYISNGVLRTRVSDPISISPSEEPVPQDFFLFAGEADIIVAVETDEAAQGNLTIDRQDGSGSRAVVTNYPMDRRSVRFFQLPEGDYRAVLERGGEEYAVSEWTRISPGQPNQLVLVLK
ncbi:MAG: carboxypeptidase regulatory-like domain-containing protein [Sumerlaeia bacterium]